MTFFLKNLISSSKSETSYSYKQNGDMPMRQQWISHETLSSFEKYHLELNWEEHKEKVGIERIKIQNKQETNLNLKT